MTEKEKSKNGELYNPMFDSELISERFKVKDLCFKYNNIIPSNIEERFNILKEILPTVNSTTIIEQPFMCDYGYNIYFGENFYANHNLVILDTTTVKFGNNVFIGPNCGFYTASHPINVEKRNQGFEYAKPITVRK